MFDITSLTFKYCLISMAVVSILLSNISARKEIPVLTLVNRWLRWLLFAWLFTFMLRFFELSARPDWVHLVTGFLLWFLVETGYNWIAIKALSRSDIPLFPSFRLNGDGDEWPTGARYEKVKNWLIRKRFERIAILKAGLFEGITLRTSIYESSDRRTRLQILFVPRRKNGVAAFYTLSTNGADDRRIITDNHSLPFGGYYPENWNIVRKPLIGTLERLFRVHEKRLTRANIESVPFEDDPMEALNQQQRLLEQFNTRCGFLNPPSYQEENGRLTYDGCYRLWKEMWLLAYLGRPVT